MPSTPDPRELTLADFPVHRPVTTRWSDNDMYGHLNNAVYYELFDSAINGWQAEHVTVDPMTDATQGVVAESSCAFYAEVAFPAPLVVGVRVVRLGRSSVTYELGLFVDPERSAVARPRDQGARSLGARRDRRRDPPPDPHPRPPPHPDGDGGGVARGQPRMSDGPLEETWESWTSRVAADLAVLIDDDWLTFTVHVPSQASSTYAAERSPRSWRRGGARPAPRLGCPTSSSRRGGSRACSRSSASATRSSRA